MKTFEEDSKGKSTSTHSCFVYNIIIIIIIIMSEYFYRIKVSVLYKYIQVKNPQIKNNARKKKSEKNRS